MMLINGWNNHNSSTAYDSNSHATSVLYGFENLRDKGLLLDVTLVAEGQEFQVHRAVLASCSEYFRAMFTDGMKETQQPEIHLKGVTAVGMKLVLDYMYTGHLVLNVTNIQHVLSAASHVQMFSAVDACSAYLQSQLDLENCLDMAAIAETYSLNRLKKLAYRFICAHLLEFSRTSEFMKITYKQMEHLLASDFPVDCTENNVLQVVMKWIIRTEFEGTELTKNKVQELLQHINFNEITKWEQIEFKQKEFSDKYGTSSLKAYSSSNYEKAPCFPSLMNTRGMEQSIVVVGGFNISGVTNDVTYFQQSCGKWRRLTSIPHIDQCNHGTVIYNNNLYVIGGCFNQSLQENIHPFGFCYNPQMDMWKSIAPMHQERCRFSLNVVQGNLYAIGGWGEMDDPLRIGEVPVYIHGEYYDPEADTWTVIAPLPEYRSQHAATTWPMEGHYLFVSGGLEKDFSRIVFKTMWRYDASNDSWLKCADMITARADHVMLTIKENIYVCGGWYEDSTSENRLLVETVDVYNVANNTWETVTLVPTPRYHAGIVSIQDKIYFIGGYYSETVFDRTSTLIECYDVKTDTWATFNKYPQAIWEHACVTLHIPRCRDDDEVKSDC